MPITWNGRRRPLAPQLPACPQRLPALSGNCKCQFTDGEPRRLRIVVGDGRSDFCVAGRADLVLAKSALLDHCRATAMPHFAFADFHEASRLMADWLEAREYLAIGAPSPRAET